MTAALIAGFLWLSALGGRDGQIVRPLPDGSCLMYTTERYGLVADELVVRRTAQGIVRAHLPKEWCP